MPSDALQDISSFSCVKIPEDLRLLSTPPVASHLYFFSSFLIRERLDTILFSTPNPAVVLGDHAVHVEDPLNTLA